MSTLNGLDRRSQLSRRISADPELQGPERRDGSDRRSGKDRRDFIRHLAEGPAFVEIKDDQGESIVGKLVDISLGGLATHYLWDHEHTFRHQYLLILDYDRDLQVDEIPVKVITDNNVYLDYMFNVASMRRCGIQFESLSEEQSKQLSQYIKRYAI